MSRKALFALSLLTLALASRCGFRFENPVEHFDASAPNPAADTGAREWPDAGMVRFDAQGLWADPSWTVEEVAVYFRGSVSAGFQTGDELTIFGAHQATFANEQRFDYASRRDGVWSGEVDFRSVNCGVPRPVAGGATPQGLANGNGSVFFERSGGHWATYQLAESAGGGTNTASLMGPSGTIEVVSAVGGSLRHGVWNGDRLTKIQITWEEIGKVGASVSVSGLLAGPEGARHLLLVDRTTREIRYWKRSQGVWTGETVRTGFEGTVGFPVLDPQRELAFCWHDSGAAMESTIVVCMRRVGGAWVTKPLTTALTQSLVVTDPVMDSQGRFHVVTSVDDGPLRQAHFHWLEEGEGWKSTRFMTLPPGAHPALAVDSNDSPHVVVSGRETTYHLIGP